MSCRERWASARDITESRRLQTRIIQDDRIRAMGTVAASVAHEINNPLTYVLTSLEATKHELESLSTALEEKTRPSDGAAIAAKVLRGIGRLQEFISPALAGTERIRQVTRELSTFTRRDDERLTDDRCRHGRPIGVETPAQKDRSERSSRLGPRCRAPLSSRMRRGSCKSW